MRFQLINLPSPDFSSLDCALTAVATYLNERTDHRAGITDLVFHRKNWQAKLKAELDETYPDWVGISVNKLYLPYAKAVVKEVRRLGYPILVGGHEVSVNPDEVEEILKPNALYIGDSETMLSETLTELDKFEEPPPSIHPLRFTGCFCDNLDDLPAPDWSLWKDLDKYYYYLGMQYMINSRGCPFSCQFCDAHGISGKVDGSYFRFMDPSIAANHLCEIYLEYIPPMFHLFDPVFTIKREWVRDFCAAYKWLGMEIIPFSVFSRVDHIDEDRARWLSEAGCKIVRMGIEAGDEHIRYDVYQKKVSNEQIRDAVRLVKSHGMAITAYYILGGPYENQQTVQKTIDLAKELDCERTVFFIYKVLTEEGEKQMLDCGATLHPETSDNITFGAVAELPSLSSRQLLRMQRAAYVQTLSKRLYRLISSQKISYLTRLIKYLWNGRKDGLNLKYLLAYFQVYSGPNKVM